MARWKDLRRRPDCERGIALVGVLAVVSLLTVLAVGALEATRRYGQLAHRSFEVVQASELADSAIRLAILELTAPPVQTAASPPPSTLAVRVFGQPLAVQIEREARRVDLNAADEVVLAATLAGKGMDEANARTLAGRILDWRDTDDEARVHGAERTEYRRASRSSGPRNDAFESISELRQVLGAETLTDEVLDAFTVYSHAREAQAQGFAESGGIAGEAARLLACAAVERTNVCRVAIVRFTGNRAQPTLVYSWSTRYRFSLSRS
jgi:general secretion pathway protein K